MTIYNLLLYANNLTETEKLLANYILENQEQVAGMSLDELAKVSFSSISTIHRLCKKIGLTGFKEFKIKFVEELYSKMNKPENIDINFPFKKDDTQFQIASNIKQLYIDTLTNTFSFFNSKQLEDAVDLIYNAEIVDVYAVTNNIQTALNFQDKMQSIGRYVNVSLIPMNQVYRAAASNNKNKQVAIILSYSGKTPEIKEIALVLKRKEIETLVICSAQENYLTKLFKYHIFVSSKENLKKKISHYSSHIATQYVLDVIFSCIFNKDYEKNMEYRLNEFNKLDHRQVEE
ncbi:MurR/RpiR family transcriptional regulator [Clostridium beijerinckii]|uniref:DNA-binding MurR/RpiR family transcriptional regulator n=1 Tax=Clostridium beijerinckii TaxID=1520 RepID=A0A9Q5CX38_CLOBE|nr:MurR/RpiR family transcriptional regulator [Clostridium beijerinckii]AQS03572.1 putative HTH-type transcriptional regulator YbbH [Clostridium beijerinckii]MBA2884829.1 DNA-binding MurR/RpiR family transcriptional regulator [Clostridium beijerinckii]MBA2899551.1 DNA-binding MurR/RpiR family transcriptional regulator [Clostridium beijerinckii]MBA2909180.1 DNA-binding MurR/RpiR family transcriptional regulator [Clostridium beijerinckii]MBA9016885.1 DNA-binding MurR/RpiR family transcriptional 